MSNSTPGVVVAIPDESARLLDRLCTRLDQSQAAVVAKALETMARLVGVPHQTKVMHCVCCGQPMSDGYHGPNGECPWMHEECDK